MRLRPVLADRLALALLQAQKGDDRRAEPEHEEERRRDRAAGPEGDVAEDVERVQEGAEIGEKGQHSDHHLFDAAALATPANRSFKASTIAPMRMLFDPLIMT